MIEVSKSNSTLKEWKGILRIDAESRDTASCNKRLAENIQTMNPVNKESSLFKLKESPVIISIAIS